MKQSGYMVLEVQLENNGFAELCGKRIKYWSGEGLPTFEGELDEFAVAYPVALEELVRCGAVARLVDRT